MSNEQKGTETRPLRAVRRLPSAIESGAPHPGKLQGQIDAKRATAQEMSAELERVTEELRSTMYVVRGVDDRPDEEQPEHPQIKQKALMMVRTALEDAIECLEREANQLEVDARENSL